MIARVKNGRADARATAPALRRALVEHNRLHTFAYGDSLIKPKHHFNGDIPGQWVRDGVSIDAFVIERAHLRVKRIAENAKNTSTSEFTVLSGLANYCIDQAASATPSADALAGRAHRLQGREDITVAVHMTVAHEEVWCGDVVARGETAGLVAACLQEGGVLYALVQVWQRGRDVSRHSAEWEATDVQDVWLASQLQVCPAWYNIGGRIYIVLRE